jgi:3D (Asp-Asp-Asp) domain-containing protein
MWRLLGLCLVGLLIQPNITQAPNFDLPDESKLIIVEKTALKAKWSEKPLSGKRLVRIITAYSSSPDETDDMPFITASGKRVRKGIIACPRKYPFGTTVVINNQVYVCEDRLHPKYDNRFDIWFSTKEEAKQWGKQIKEVILLE